MLKNYQIVLKLFWLNKTGQIKQFAFTTFTTSKVILMENQRKTQLMSKNNSKELQQTHQSKDYWVVCPACKGQGKKRKRLSKKIKLNYQKALEQFEKITPKGIPPVPPKGSLLTCLECAGSGLQLSDKPAKVDLENFPQLAIIGGGIGGVALAVACLHRGIPFTLYERDSTFDARSQGYGLTLQQASKAIEGFGILSLAEGVVSTRHVVHTTEGEIIGEWGVRKWMESDANYTAKRTNIHIARQLLRRALVAQLGGDEAIQWGHQLLDFATTSDKKMLLNFEVDGKTKSTKADLVVGADGIRSTVRRLLVGEKTTPLRYLGCIVILGICPLKALDNPYHSLLDAATVFQTANGNERIYIMPYTSDSVMWQLSFPMSEKEAKALSAQGTSALKAEAQRRTKWHDPVPQIVAATEEIQISGYPVYDRELLQQEILKKEEMITLIGDAAHPMSPFKGQGANQALLDALRLARDISMGCKPLSQWRKTGIRESVLNDFEAEMLERSAIKVNDSAKAAEFLHTEMVLHKSDSPRGKSSPK